MYPIFHYLLAWAYDDRRWGQTYICAYSFNNCNGLPILRTCGIKLLDLCRYNDNFPSRTSNSDARFIHVVYILGLIDIILCQCVLMVDKKCFQVLFRVCHDSSSRNRLCFNRMKTWVFLQPLLKPNLRGRVQLLCFAKMADCCKNNCWGCCNSHLPLLMVEPANCLFWCLRQDNSVATMTIKGSLCVAYLFPLT